MRRITDICVNFYVSITATNGVVVATEKKVSSPLVDETMVKKIAEIDKHLGMVYSGVSLSVLSRARVFFRAVHSCAVARAAFCGKDKDMLAPLSC